MELTKIENLIEKYFEAETSSADEQVLRDYFSSPNVAQHLQQYQSVFEYFKQAKNEQFTANVPLQTKKRNVKWLSIAASVTILFGVATFIMLNNQAVKVSGEYGSYDNPEIALKETQKALAMLSNHVNTGIESVNYLSAYQNSKEKIFK